MKRGKKLCSILLAVCMLLCMLPTAAFAAGSGDYMKIAMLDSGRKYFTPDWVKSFIYEAKADGYTHVMLAVGNDGMRLLLDDMSVTVNGTAYASADVSAAVHAGNTAYTSASSGEWTESEMNEIFAAANAAGIEIIPLLNSPGHMDAILQAASSLTGTTCSYNGSSRTIDVTNSTAVAFTQAFIQKYIDYFAAKGCKYFNFGADEYANDRYTSGSMGFGSLQSSGKYGYFIKYVNELSTMVKSAGMTPIAFNDGIEFANRTSAAVGSTTYTFDKDIVVCYWSSGWSGYSPRSASNLASDGFRIINTTGDFYYVLGKNDNFDSGYTYASNWSNYKVCGSTLSTSSVIGGMFCMWSDYPGAETQTQEAAKIRLPLRAMGLAMDGSYTYSLDTSVVPGGFNADGSINTDPPAQVHNYQQTAAQAATCTQAGSVTYTCTDCGESYTETIPALGHDYAATDDDGDTIYTCTRCGERYSELLPREYVSLKVGETSGVYTLDGEQTVTKAGNAAVAAANLRTVAGTGTTVSYAASASASVGGYTDGGYNCTADKLIDGDTSTYYWSTGSQTRGMYARVDLGAQVRFDAVQISAPAHGDYCTNANVQVSADGADWTSIGTYTSSSSRAVTSTYAVPDSVESFRYIQVVLTTARNYWWQLSEIAWGSYDGANFTRAAASGTVTTGTSAATELSFTGTGAGSTYYVIGGTRYVINVEENHVHDYQVTARTAPTCTEAGSITYTCAECGDSYTQTVPALGHDYDAAVTAPTCESGGCTTYTCTRCGESHTADETAALGHDYAAEITPATCTEDGTARYTCTRCGDSYTEVLPATGHHYTASVSAATCTQPGETTYTCTGCGDSYTETTPALGHDYRSIVTAPTCTEGGYTTHTCERCGDSYTDAATAALGHDYDAVVTAPTCTEDGYTTHTCEHCGDSYTDAVIAAPGHDYTCTKDGDTLTYTCTRCGDAYTEELIPTVAVNLQVGGSYTFTTANADITETADASIVSVSVRANAAGYSRVTSVSEGRYLLVCNGSLLTTNSSTYYSSWDGAGTVSGLACVSYSAGGSYDAYLWTIKAVPGGYTVQSADGRYLSLTAGTRSSNLTLSDTAQVLTISDLGETFSITSGSAYLDRYSSSFAASYPGAGNVNEQWQLYRAQEADYDVTITGVSEGETSVVLGGVRYAVTVHAHHYTEETTAPATCTESGTMTYTCAGCGDSYTETIPALGHDYVRTEQDGQYVYTCTRCGESYTEPIVTTTYRSVSSISSGSSYVITVYSSGKYYALTHTGGALGVTAVTVSNGQIVSDVTDDMRWTYSGGKLGFTSGGANYYLGRYGYSSLSISTSGSRASYSSSRLSLGGYYLRYSNGYFSLNWRSASTCYMFEQTN